MVLLSCLSLCIFAEAKASTPPAEERETFLTQGILPFAPSGPATLFAPLLRRSAGTKKVTKEMPFRI